MFPHHAPAIKHLRDVNGQNLRCDPADLYRILSALPASITLARVRAELSDASEEERASLDRLLANQTEPEGGYPVRAVCLFGLAEMERSREAFRALEEGNPERFGQLMKLSHDGDRVATAHGHGHDGALSDRDFRRLIERADEHPLALQPGGYACSTKTIDHIVDAAISLPGVFGAQLAGAGLGGCAMVLARATAADTVTARLNHMGYEADIMRPVQGACALRHL
jgi:N-acetylgalactosamine kinase